MEQSFRQLSIEGLKPFARGGTGECYRLNEDTILKLYYEDFPVERILREKEGARAALVAGVPTAISFDLVRAGNRRGVVYELVEGKTLAEVIVKEPQRAKELGGILADIALTLHHAEAVCADLPSPTVPIRKEYDKVDYAPEDVMRRIADFLDELDREDHYVHGDFHPNNVVMTRSGPMLIDMGGFSRGCPMFDLATLRFSLFESPEARKEGRSSFNGLSRDEALALWEGFEQTYFCGPMDPRSADLVEKITVLKMLRFERLYGGRYDEEICGVYRDRVLRTFGK